MNQPTDLALALNPFDAGFKSDPYPVYAELRATLPIHRSPLGAWIVADYATCDQVLRSRDFGKDFANSTFFDQLTAMIGDDMPPFLGLGIDGDARPFMLTDPPEHTRLRGLVANAFTRSTTGTMAAVVAAAAERAVGIARTATDFVSEVAEPFPIEVLAEILGIPDADKAKFTRWSRLVAGVLDINFAIPKEVAQQRQTAIDESLEYFRSLARTRATGGLISSLAAVSDDSGRLSLDEVAATCLLITVAGQETTSNTLGNMMICFSRNPDQYRLLRENRSLVDSAVAEVLRYEPPAHEAGRIALADIEIGGHAITEGDAVMVLLASANREAVEDGDQFLVDRTEVKSLSYGLGIHHCLGSALANSMLTTFLSKSLEQFESLAVEEPIAYRPGMGLRGPATLATVLGEAGH
ncbi:cytochrome P450 [Nocardia sp. NPDC020380]|uniref:cytochrome P450 n=1 Tax=Nocardia sp. NPDC020380 TaxID=3364309 RepID=UPI003788F591